MRKILKHWYGQNHVEIPISVFVEFATQNPHATVNIQAHGDDDWPTCQVEITRPETDDERTIREVAAERQRKLDAIAEQEVEKMQYEMLKAKYGS